MKTVFITIGRGLLARNILRNDFFDLLKNNNDIRTVLLFSDTGKATPPEYIEKEFSGDNVIVEFPPNNVIRGFRRIFLELARNLVFSPTTKLYAKHGTSKVPKKNKLTNILLFIIYTPLSKINFLKKIVRWIEIYIFRDSEYGKYFDKYKPDLVFSTALLSGFDLAFLKNARRRGIKTISMPKSWDNLDKILFRFESDFFVIQNEHMLDDSVRYQGFNKDKIKVIGFPQFDIYKKDYAIESRKDYCVRHGFDFDLPIIFIGSEGLWSKGDEGIYEKIIKFREEGKIPSCNIIIRPHFSLLYNGQYDHFKKYKNIFIDNTYRLSNFYIDNWDPTRDDMKDFTNTLRHCSLSVNFASTLSLDAVCFDKPIVNIAFGIRFEKNKQDEDVDVTPIIYETGFYREVIKTNATTLVYNYEELAEAIKKLISNSKINGKGREELRNKLCYKIDGQAGQRLYDLFVKILE